MRHLELMYLACIIETLYPLTNISLYSTTTKPWKKTFYSLLLQVWLFQTPHINGTMYYLSFCIWLILLRKMTSKFMCIAKMAVFYSFLGLNHIPFVCVCIFTHIYHIFTQIHSRSDRPLGYFHTWILYNTLK